MEKKWYENIEELVISSSENLRKEWENDPENFKVIKAVLELLAKE